MSKNNLRDGRRTNAQKVESTSRNSDNRRVAPRVETILSTVPGNVLPDPMPQPISEKRKLFKRWWPSILVGALAGAVVALSRGCWHGKLGWPVRAKGYSYQVCLTCGAMRLFDENTFRGYGPFRYDLNKLIALEKAKGQRVHLVAGRNRTA